MIANSRRNKKQSKAPTGAKVAGNGNAGAKVAGNVHYNPYSGHKPARDSITQSLNKFKGVTQFGVAVIVAAIPISFYLVQPSDIQNAFASNEKDSDIKQIMSTLGGSIKDKASSVFSGDKTMEVQVTPLSSSQSRQPQLSQSSQAQPKFIPDIGAP